MSRGGYQKLKETIKQHHLEETPDGSGDDSASIGDPPSPPRHELWKRARLKPSGEYTSETAALVAKKIVSKYLIIIIILIVTSLHNLLHVFFVNYIL